MKDPRRRLLDAAEQLLAEDGYEGLSIRAVNKKAGMNPAAVHYHFGSKQELVTAVVARRVGPVWAPSLAELDRMSAEETAPGVEDLARLLVEPMAQLAADPEGSGRWLLPLLARLVLGGHWSPSKSPWSGPDAWITLLGRALPWLPADAVAARWRLARDLVLITYAAPMPDPRAVPPPPSVGVVVAFITAGLAAPRPAPDRPADPVPIGAIPGGTTPEGDTASHPASHRSTTVVEPRPRERADDERDL